MPPTHLDAQENSLVLGGTFDHLFAGRGECWKGGWIAVESGYTSTQHLQSKVPKDDIGLPVMAPQKCLRRPPPGHPAEN